MTASGTGTFLDFYFSDDLASHLTAAFHIYFRSAKAIKLKRLDLSNVKKFTMI